jgi:hypothetical protein
MKTDKRLEPGTRVRLSVRLKGRGLPGARPRFATIVQSSFRKMPVGWVIPETDDGCRERVHADRFVVNEREGRLIHFRSRAVLFTPLPRPVRAPRRLPSKAALFHGGIQWLRVPQILDAVKIHGDRGWRHHRRPRHCGGVRARCRGRANQHRVPALSRRQDFHAPSPSVQSAQADGTALTNLMTGRPARGFINRLMREIGPISAEVPEFPLAVGAPAPLRGRQRATWRAAGTRRGRCDAGSSQIPDMPCRLGRSPLSGVMRASAGECRTLAIYEYCLAI